MVERGVSPPPPPAQLPAQQQAAALDAPPAEAWQVAAAEARSLHGASFRWACSLMHARMHARMQRLCAPAVDTTLPAACPRAVAAQRPW
jgi:hypothetical protein